MEILGIDFWIQMVVYAVSLGTFGGTVVVRLTHLEKKMDKHNHIVERVIETEARAKSNTHRLDRLEKN